MSQIIMSINNFFQRIILPREKRQQTEEENAKRVRREIGVPYVLTKGIDCIKQEFS
jgi:hypothetical protein